MAHRARSKRVGKPSLDRWGTLNAFTLRSLGPLVKETKSPSVGLVWFVMFTLANGKNGTIRGASVTRLARLTGLDRMTVRKALGHLLAKGAMKIQNRDTVVPAYLMQHLAIEADD